MRGELVVGADQRAQTLVVFRQRGELDAVGQLVDLDLASPGRSQAGHVDLEHVSLHSCCRDCPSDTAVFGEGVGVEAAQVGEAPRLHRRVRERQRPVELERVGAVHESLGA